MYWSDPSTSSSSVPEAIAASSTSEWLVFYINDCPLLGTVDKVKKVIKDVLISKNSLLNNLSKEALPDLASQLYTVGLITKAVKDNPLIDKFIDEFNAIIACQEELPEIQEHCQKFLNSFSEVGGSYAAAARVVHKHWVEKSDTALYWNWHIDNLN